MKNLILMERLEGRENKGIVDLCIGTVCLPMVGGVNLGIRSGVDS